MNIATKIQPHNIRPDDIVIMVYFERIGCEFWHVHPKAKNKETIQYIREYYGVDNSEEFHTDEILGYYYIHFDRINLEKLGIYK